ncbi:MAG: hypothetical protein V1743_07325 [Nanoarchaeota archaeon]
MNAALKAVLATMLNKHYIGGKHIPEDKIVKSKTQWLQKHELDEFETEYKQAVNSELFIRLKKRTGKGSDWHISLNPRKLKEIYEMIK